MDVLGAILAGVALAACAGLRIFLPLFAVGIAGRFLDWPLASSLVWLTSDPALVLFGVATLVEIVADKMPAVDRTLDLIQTVLTPISGYLAALSPFATLHLPVPLGVVFALGAGLGIGGGMHILADSARIASGRTTGGLGDPFLSAAEDGFALVAAVFAIVAPLLALPVVLLPVILWIRRLRDDAAKH